MMNRERTAQNLALYAELEQAARNTLQQIANWVCDIEDRKATDDVTPYTHRVIQSTHGLQGTLDALDAFRDASEAQPAEVCATCKWWMHEQGCALASVSYQMTNGRGFYPPATFGCTEWRAKP
jgi:hypothetical protein